MGTYYSPTTGMHYSSKEQMEAMEKKYFSDLEKQKIRELEKQNQMQQEMYNQQQLQLQQEQERIKAERENAEIKSRAIKQAEQDRFNNQLQLEILRMSSENIKRYQRLCDDMGVDYNDLDAFGNWLNNLTEEQLAHNKEVLTKIDEMSTTDEIKEATAELEKLKLEVKNKNVTINKQIEVRKGKNNKLVFKGSENLINDVIKTTQKHIKQWNYSIAIYFTFVIFIMGILVSSCDITSVIEGFIGMLLMEILIGLFFLKIRAGNKKNLKLMKEKLDKYVEQKKNLTNEIAELQKQINRQESKTNTLVEKRAKELENNIEYKELLKQKVLMLLFLTEGYTPNKKEFYEFRINHYNKDMEILLRKLEIKLDRIKKEDIISEGTKEDYIQFIEDKLI